MMPVLEACAGVLLTLALHATVLLGLVWLAERLRLLRHPGWRELLWRGALFGALLSTTFEYLDWPQFAPDAAPRFAEATPAMPPPIAAETAPEEGTALAIANTPPAPLRAEAQGAPANGDAGTTTLSLPAVAIGILLAAWGLGTLILGLRALRQWHGLRGLREDLSRRAQSPSPALLREARRVADALALPPPQLCLLPDLGSPLLLPEGLVVLPSWTVALPREQQRALLAHEFAHLQRRDPAWRLAQRLALLPLHFHPLAWLAVHRLEAIAEDACDARAAQLLGDGRPLADCLAECLSHAGARAGHPALAVAMAGESGPVLRRVKRLLEDAPMLPKSLSPAMRRTAIGVGLVALIALPGLAVTSFASDGLGRLLEIDGRNNMHYSDRQPDGRLEASLRGEIGFNEAESDVVALADGGELEIIEERDGVRREIRFRAVDGQIVRRYRVDGSERALDADGRGWLARIIPEMLRQSGFQARERAGRILARGGNTALLQEIGRIRSDHGRSTYLRVLFADARLNEAELQQGLALAEPIGSDFELRQALQTALEKQALSPDRQVQLLRLAQQIGSDFERAELLASLVESHALQGEVLAAWRAAQEGIGSDFEQRRVLEALLERGRPAPATLVAALDSAQGIGSDFEKRSVLEAAVPRLREAPAAIPAWLRLADGLGSDFERRSALEALIEGVPLDAATAAAVLDVIEGMGSDFETRSALETLAAKMPEDAALIARYRRVARGLGDFERSQAEQALDRFAP
jgi:hypothetical protein